MLHRRIFALVLGIVVSTRFAGAVPTIHCPPSEYICEGACPPLPRGAELPPEEYQGGGLCLKDSNTDACVCWLRNSEEHLQTLFKCEVAANNSVKHVMCLPPSHCFPPDSEPGCLIVLSCPCATRGVQFGNWRSTLAIVLRSRTPVTAIIKEGTTSTTTDTENREFSLKHLLFLLAFVVAPLLCWCLLTFFHERKCRKRSQEPIQQPQEAALVSAAPQDPLPTAPKIESPPPYREALDGAEACLLQDECGPPPSYEDAVWGSVQRAAQQGNC